MSFQNSSGQSGSHSEAYPGGHSGSGSLTSGQPGTASGGNSNIEAALAGLLRSHGESLLSESGRLKSFLHDECPTARREIGVLIQALEESVPQDLMRVHSGEPAGSLVPRLVGRLSEEKSMDRRAADWAVRTWARGLGIEAGIAPPEPLPPSGHGSLPSRLTQEASWLNIDPLPQNNTAIVVPDPRPVPQRNTLVIAGVALLALAIGAFAWFKPLAPPPVVLPSITEIKVPSPIYVGRKAQTLTVAYTVGSNDAVTLRSHVVEGAVPSAPAESTVALTATPGQKAGSVPVPLPASKQPYRATLEFVVVDAKGNASVPQRVSYEVLPAPVVRQACATCGTVVSVVESQKGSGGVSGLGAAAGAVVGGVACSFLGKGSGKVAASLGCAAAAGYGGNEIEKKIKSGKKSYTVTVRFDDGHRQTFPLTDAAGYGKGTRVNVIDGELTPEG